jgi:hypothetical protein
MISFTSDASSLKKKGKSSFYVTSHGTITWKDEYKFDEYLEQANKKDAKLQKGKSQRLFNARRQDKLRFQVSKGWWKTFYELSKETQENYNVIYINKKTNWWLGIFILV